MKSTLTSIPAEKKAAISRLFDESPPILVEVRFPKAGTSSDWHLFEEEEELEDIMERLGLGAELHISSVWDLSNKKGEICVHSSPPERGTP